jgi:hypothetical protein
MKNVSLHPCVFAFLLLASPLAQAQFTWTTNADNTITLTGYTGPDGSVAIPENITGLPVTGIGDYAFDNTSLISVTIPGSVTDIGDGAFADCTNLTTVAIPNSVTTIGDDAFGNCSSLTGITVDPANSFYSSTNGVLFDKPQTTLVQYPGGVNEGYTIPNSVTSVRYAAFEGSALTNITIPDSVTNIGAGAPFAGCVGLTAISVDGQNSFYSSVNGVLFDKSQTTLIQFPQGEAGVYAIPGSVTSIGVSAFEGSDLSSVTIPGSVTNIGVQAFYASSLANVIIGNGVTTIGDDAFASCSNLRSALFKGNSPAFGYNVFPWFYTISNRATVYVPVTTLYFLPGSFWPDPWWHLGYLPMSSFYGTLNFPLVELERNPLIQTGDGSFGVQNGQFGFNITGTADIPIVVEACSNLANPVWTPLAAMTLTNGSVYFSEPVQTNSPGRFYRIGSP